MYDIKIMSRGEAIIYDCKDHKEDYLLISINSIGQTHHKFRNVKIKDVLYLDFEDVTDEYIKLDVKLKHKLMSIEQSLQLKEFIQNNLETKTIIIHCEMGVSRSGAIGCFLAEYLNGDNMYMFRKGRYLPNKWVYKLLSVAFNIPFNELEFNEKCKISTLSCKTKLEEIVLEDGSKGYKII